MELAASFLSSWSQQGSVPLLGELKCFTFDISCSLIMGFDVEVSQRTAVGWSCSVGMPYWNEVRKMTPGQARRAQPGVLKARSRSKWSSRALSSGTTDLHRLACSGIKGEGGAQHAIEHTKPHVWARLRAQGMLMSTCRQGWLAQHGGPYVKYSKHGLASSWAYRRHRIFSARSGMTSLRYRQGPVFRNSFLEYTT